MDFKVGDIVRPTQDAAEYYSHTVIGGIDKLRVVEIHKNELVVVGIEGSTLRQTKHASEEEIKNTFRDRTLMLINAGHVAPYYKLRAWTVRCK